MATEKRLIDVDEAIGLLGCEDWDIATKHFLEECPTVDAVEVVRCKDCESYHPYGSCLNGSLVTWGKCMKIDMDVDMPANGYCCYGERRPNAQT